MAEELGPWGIVGWTAGIDSLEGNFIGMVDEEGLVKEGGSILIE